MADNELGESELKDLVNSLTSNCCQVVEKSLLKLHKHFGIDNNFTSTTVFWHPISTRDVKEFYQIGGFTYILQLLLKPNAKWMEKAIDILTNCFNLEECREMNSNTETISLITSTFKFYYKNEIIQVSLCKTITNLSRQQEACTIFHNFDINSAIVDLLLYCQLSDSNRVATGTLQCLNLTPPLREQTIQIILSKFNPTNDDLMIKVLRIVAEMTSDVCNHICTQQIQTVIGFANLVTYAQSSDKNLQRASIRIFNRISSMSNEIRREIGEAGMVPIYINLTQEFLHDVQIRPLSALCQLLRHVDNRDRLFQIVNGFETLISLLCRWDEFNRMIQQLILNAIECFFPATEYNDSHILKLLNLNLVSILVNILDKYVKTRETTHELIEGTESVTFTQIGSTELHYIRQIRYILTIIASKHKFHFSFLDSAILEVLMRSGLFRLSRSFDQSLRLIENIVMTLVCSDVCFEHLILLQFPQMVQKIMDDSALPHSVHLCNHVQLCKICILKEFESKVNSEYGLENVNRLLTRGSESVKRTVALILPYIERCSQVSSVYYLALELFLKNLADPSNDNYQVSLNIFFEMCEKGQSSDVESFSHEAHKRDYCALYGKEFDKDVHFILDDGERVSANRSILIQSSDMFDAMLNGHFMEANQSEIRFKCASTEIFRFILHFLHGCTDSGETSCRVLRSAHCEFLLEASDMADRMMLMNLKNAILGIIVKKLTKSSVLSVYRYAQQNNHTAFFSFLVDHLVKLSVGKNYKTELFTQILSSDLNEHLIDIIKLKIESVTN